MEKCVPKISFRAYYDSCYGKIVAHYLVVDDVDVDVLEGQFCVDVSEGRYETYNTIYRSYERHTRLAHAKYCVIQNYFKCKELMDIMKNQNINKILGNGDFNPNDLDMKNLPTADEVASKLYELFYMKVNRIKTLYHLNDEDFDKIFKPKT